ncbi:hypothetical protein EUX98_g9757 [Antrodiella citrinella]|uniref:Protein kinase domain-containing protein n=1 Tax=Antrodiella citrinella TaxID=2447956 RepID=A0A4S4LNQ6_9APHY|nr:hypothetical protein EUX98_g9757 [Antrodiella citrinella]
MSSTGFTGFTLQFRDLPSVRHIARRLHNYPDVDMGPGRKYKFHLRRQRIRISEILYSGKRTTVYLGRCKNETEVVLKFTDTEDILEEAGAYDVMAAIQGKAVPRVYGALHGKDRRGGNMSCLVMERFGMPLEREFSTLTKRDKAKILDNLVAVHHAGLRHLDFAERNVLVEGDEYRIVDFGQAEEHRTPCKWTYSFLEHLDDDDVNDDAPCVDCEAIKSWAEQMRFWDHGNLRLACAFFVPKSDKLPTQSVIDSMKTVIGLDQDTIYYPEQTRQITVRYFEEIRRRMTAGQSLQELQEQREWITYLVHKQWHDERYVLCILHRFGLVTDLFV